MLDLRLHSNGAYWQATWIAPDGRRRRKNLGPKTAVSRRAAERALLEFRDRLARTPAMQAQGVAVTRCTVAEWVDRYFALHPELAPATVALQRRTGALLVDRFGQRRLDSIAPLEAAQWRADLMAEAGMAENTARKHTRVARAMWNHAVRLGIADANPFAGLPASSIAIDHDERRLVSIDEFERVLADAPHATAPAWAVAFFAGLRTSEVFDLRVEDIDAAAGRLRVRNRGGRRTTKKGARVVRLEPRLLEILEPLMAGAPGDARAVGQAAWSARSIASRQLQMRAAQAGIADARRWTMQWLRQSRDTHWRAAGFPAYVVCAWLGHSEQIARRHYLTVPEGMYRTGAKTAPVSSPNRPSDDADGGFNGPGRTSVH